MKIKHKRWTADILLLAASYIHRYGHGEYLGNRYCCDAIGSAMDWGDDESHGRIKDLLYSVFCTAEVNPGFLHFIWSSDTADTEERILGLLLLREMVLNDDLP